MNYYCQYCGGSNSSIQHLTNTRCNKSPSGYCVPYQGAEQSSYTCRYCGATNSTIRYLTNARCNSSPNGYHQPL